MATLTPLPEEKDRTQIQGGSEGTLTPITPSDAPVQLGGRTGFDANFLPETARKGLKAAQDFGGLSQSVDYRTGVQDLGFRTEWGLLRSDKERRSFLDKTVGTTGWFQDKAGNHVLTPSALTELGVPNFKVPTAIDERNIFPTFSKFDVAELAGEAPVLGGAMAGGAAGAKIGGLGGGLLGAGVGGVAGAAFGAGMGSLTTEQARRERGLSLATEAETLQRAGTEAGLAVMGEGVSRGVLAPIGRKVLAPFKSKITPQREALMREALDAGVRPRGAAISKAKVPARIGQIAETVIGDVNEERNLTALNSLVGDLRKGTQATLRSATEAGELIRTDIIRSRRALSKWAEGRYANIDRALGAEPTVPTDLLRTYVTDIVEGLPKTRRGKTLRVFTEAEQNLFQDLANLPERISFSQAQNLRRRLRSFQESGRLTESFDSAAARNLDGVIGKSMRQVETTDPALNAYIDATLTRYGSEIKKYKKALVQRLAKNPEQVGFVPEEQIVDLIVQPNNTAAARSVMPLLKPPRQAQVRVQALESILQNAWRHTDSPVEGVWNGQALLRGLDHFGRETLNEIFGKETTGQLYKLGRVAGAAQMKVAGASGGIIAAQIGAHPIRNLGKLMQLHLLAKVMSSEAALRWLTVGAQKTWKRDATAEASRFMVLLTATMADEMSLGDLNVIPSPPVPQPVQQGSASFGAGRTATRHLENL